MRIHTFLVAALALTGAQLTAQNPYVRTGAGIGIIADPRARNIGDILTVQIQEQTSVVNNDKVERTNSTSLSARLEAFTIDSAAFNAGALPSVDLTKGQDMRGEAKQNSASTVRARSPRGAVVRRGGRHTEWDGGGGAGVRTRVQPRPAMR